MSSDNSGFEGLRGYVIRGGEGVLESEVMEEEVMEPNVWLYSSEFFEYLPFVKGTSDENERVSELERVMEVVS